MPNQQPNLNQQFNQSAPPPPSPSASPPPSYYRESFPPIPPVQKSKPNLIKIVVGLFLVIILGTGTALAVRIWDPLWSPFRPEPEKVTSKMTEKMPGVKTLHTDLNVEVGIQNESEFNIKGKVLADIDKTDPQNLKSAVGTDINLSLMEGLQISLGFEAKQIGETTYVKLTTIPVFPLISAILVPMGIELKELEDKWVKLDKNSFKNLLGQEYGKYAEEQEKAQKEQKDLLEKFKKIIENKKLYSVKKELPDEEIENNKVYHYIVALNKEEIKKIIPELFNIASEASGESANPLSSLSLAKQRAKEARIIADMMQLRMMVEIIFSDKGGYYGVNCGNQDISYICEDIAEQIGIKPILKSTKNDYIAYTSLPVKGYYFCVDSKLSAVTTSINPQTVQNFICPKAVAISAADRQKSSEEEFSKELDKFFEKIGELSGELWIGKKDNLLYRFKGEKLFDLSDFKEGGKGTISIKLNIDYSKFNQPINIEAPKEFKKFEEILGQSLIGAQNRAK